MHFSASLHSHTTWGVRVTVVLHRATVVLLYRSTVGRRSRWFWAVPAVDPRTRGPGPPAARRGYVCKLYLIFHLGHYIMQNTWEDKDTEDTTQSQP